MLHFMWNSHSPNPTRNAVNFEYVLPAAGTTEPASFDLPGRRVCWMESRRVRKAGRHGSRWDGHAASGRRVSPGICLARLAFEQEVLTRWIVVIERLLPIRRKPSGPLTESWGQIGLFDSRAGD